MVGKERIKFKFIPVFVYYGLRANCNPLAPGAGGEERMSVATLTERPELSRLPSRTPQRGYKFK